MKFPTYEEWGEKIAGEAMDIYTINGRTIREWVEILSDELTMLEKIRSEIEEKYGDYDICEWFENYDYEENDISEYQHVGNVSDILAIIDKYKAESEAKE